MQTPAALQTCCARSLPIIRLVHAHVHAHRSASQQQTKQQQHWDSKLGSAQGFLVIWRLRMGGRRAITCGYCDLDGETSRCASSARSREHNSKFNFTEHIIDSYVGQQQSAPGLKMRCVRCRRVDPRSQGSRAMAKDICATRSRQDKKRDSRNRTRATCCEVQGVWCTFRDNWCGHN